MTPAVPDHLALVLYIVAGINALLGAIVLWRHQREQHLTFALTAFFVALWTLTNALFHIATMSSLATLWAQLAYVAALGTGASLLHFAWSFPRSSGSRLSRCLVWSAAIIISVLAFVPSAIIERVDVDERRIITAPGIYLIALFLLLTLGYAFVLFWHNQARLQRRRRAQARLVLYGSSLTTIIGLFFNLALPLLGDYRFVWLGPLSSLFFVGFSAYAIIATHLFDVRLLIRRTFVYSFLLATLAGGFAVLEKGLEHLLSPLLGTHNSFLGELFAALLVGFAVDPLKHYFKQIAARRFFRGETNED
ncbi:hypothetical protein IAD21_06028 [Abditibacteriota bacterium]|nr:hypothetical protein IAD21_06028 [Abditibacteriota bacterium]